MGMVFAYKCKDCGYTTRVSGGSDVGMSVKTQTGYCVECNELVDYITEFHEPLSPPDDLAVIGICRKCGKPVTKDWNDGDPCPRCGGAFGEKTPIMMWD